MSKSAYVKVKELHPARRRSRELSLANQLAVISLSRALRPLIHRSRRFVATIVVPPGASVFTYSMAAHWLIDNPREDGVPITVPFDVLTVNDDNDVKNSVKVSKAEEVHRAIIILKSEEMLTSEYHMASDLVAVLPPPAAADIKIAAVRMGFGRIKDKDAEFLASQDLARLTLAMRRGRSLSNAVARLTRFTAQEEPLVPTQEGRGPTLEELSAYGEAKTWGQELAEDVADWRSGKLAWTDVDRGMLLSGPPGCGKTTYATALANTCSMTLVAASAARWQAQGHLGDLLKAMRSAFDEAKRCAPSVLFIDEFDSFSSREGLIGENANYQRQVVNGLLECMDGVEAREGVVVIGATNFPELVDEALLRPGRLERHCVIPLPDMEARHEIFRYHLREDLKSESLERAVAFSRQWTGADIERTVRDARRSARRAGRVMELDDLLSAMPSRTPLPPEMLEAVAIHEIGHAIVGVLAEADPLISVSVEESFVNNGTFVALGGAVFKEASIRRKTSTYFENRIAMLLAGVAAERVVYGNHSNGAAGNKHADLNMATDLATMMEVTWGFGKWMMSEVCRTPAELAELRGRKPELADVVESILRAQFDRATAMLNSRRELLVSLAASLVERKRLYASDIVSALGNHGQKSGGPTLVLSS